MRRELLENDNVRAELCKQYPVEYEYAPHPFRSSAISEAMDSIVDTGIDNDCMCWVGYDWCGNAVGIAKKEFIPFPTIIPKVGEIITIQRIGNEWMYLIGTFTEICDYHNINT